MEPLLAASSIVLSNEEGIVFALAKKAYNRIICAMDFRGACYHMTFLLKAILHKELRIETTAVIGFVNDGDPALMVPHGWLEYLGRKIDIALAAPNDGLRAGPVLILDQRFLEQDTGQYTYHRGRGPAEDQALLRLMRFTDSRARRLLRQRENEHIYMMNIAESDEEIMAYLNAAPAVIRYEQLLALLLSKESAP
jgi:hypothetical protein